MRQILLLCMLLYGWSFQAQENGECPSVDNPVQSFCESEGSGNDFYRPAVQHLQASAEGDVLWYDTATSTEALGMDELLVDGEDYYAGSASGDCEARAVVTVTLSVSPNAGGTSFLEIALNSEPIDLLDIYNPSILGAPDAGGFFDPPLASGTTIFDPSVDQGGQYEYNVTSTSTCPDDSSYIYITVVPENPNPDDPTEEQNCPVVENTNPVFCESQGSGNYYYKPSVEHLEASANGDEVAWYATASSLDPLSPDEILVDGEDYYAGNINGTCAERVQVIATVNTSPNAGGTSFVSICANSAPIDLLDYMNPSQLGPADEGGVIDPPIASGTTVFDPAVDAGGQYRYHVASTNDTCEDDMAVIYVTVTDAATAGNDIEVNFQQGDDPVDLYSLLENATPGTEASILPTLASGTMVFDPAMDAEGIYTITVFNEEGCEDDSATVTITIGGQADEPENCPIVDAPVQSFCESEGSGNDFYRPSVANLTADPNGAELRWYDTEFSGEPLDPTEILVDGEDYYAGNAVGACSERQQVIVNLQAFPNAGGTTFYTVSSSAEPFDILDIYSESILGPPDAGGTVDPPLASGTTIFDPAVDAAGQYNYIVVSTTDCPDDRSFFTITIEEEEEESSAEAGVAMYPNPSHGQVNFTLEEGVNASSIRIIDLNGNTVRTLILESQDQLQNLDISALKPSLYFAEIVTNKGKIVKRILKN